MNDTALSVGLKNFVTNPDISEIYKETQKIYPELSFLEKDLTNAFKRYKHHFPDSNPPTVVADFSGFNYAVFTHDSTLQLMCVQLQRLQRVACCPIHHVALPRSG